MTSARLSSSEPDANKRRKMKDALEDVKCCVPRFLTIHRNDTERTMKDLSQFYIQKALDQMAGPVKNTSRLRDGPILVETKTDDQSKKLLKQKLLGSYTVLVEKHKILNSTRGVIFCPQVDECSDEQIQIGLADQYASKVYRVHKEKRD